MRPESSLAHFYRWDNLMVLGFKLLLVLGLIYACAYFLKRYGIKEIPTPSQKTASQITLLSSQRLSAQSYLQLVEVENERLLLAVHAEGVTLLKNYPQTQEPSNDNDTYHSPTD